jgi:hypothetical protein
MNQKDCRGVHLIERDFRMKVRHLEKTEISIKISDENNHVYSDIKGRKKYKYRMVNSRLKIDC